MATTPPLNTDYERRPFWHASMPALPDRSGRELPAETGVVVVGGGYAGITAARELARRGVAVTVLEAHTLGWGASTRNGGIVHAGYKWSAGQLIKRYGAETGTALYQETLESYDLVRRLIDDEGIDCDFREVGHLELAYAPIHVPELRRRAREPGVGRRALDGRAARAHPRGDRQRRVLRGPGGRGQRAPPPGALLRGARRPPPTAPEPISTKASGRAASGASAMGRSLVETTRGTVRARDVFVATNGYTDGVMPWLRRRIIPIGSFIIASEPLPADLAHELSPKGRAFFDTKNFLYYWHVSADRRMVFGGRASFMPTSIDHTAGILWRGLLEVHPQLADHRIEYAWGGNVGFTFDRMPHVGRTKDGVAYAMGCCGSGVALMTNLGTKVGAWLAGDEAPSLARLRFPLVPAPYEGHPWFMPIAGEWYRLQDRLAARTRTMDSQH